jgi:hypothetical protein
MSHFFFDMLHAPRRDARRSAAPGAPYTVGGRTVGALRESTRAPPTMRVAAVTAHITAKP